MKFVIQTDIFAEEGYEALLTAVDRLGMPKCLVKCIPFGGGLEFVEGELPLPDERAVVLGSYTLCRVAREHEWTPGAFLDNLDFETQRGVWHSRMLNFDAKVGSLGALTPFYSPKFIRPVHDTKSFTGQVFDCPTWSEWVDRLRALSSAELTELNLDTQIMVARPKEIYSETRCWVVRGKVVTASGYKVGTIKRYTAPEQVDQRIVDYAQACADVWCPNEAFVIDIAETPDGYSYGGVDQPADLRIVEVNCLNSAGWYRADMNKLVQALSEL